MKELKYKDFLKMEGEKVLVKDLTYGYEDQICEVTFTKRIDLENGHTWKQLSLENYDYAFEYDDEYNKDGKCLNGEFKVYLLEKK